LREKFRARGAKFYPRKNAAVRLFKLSGGRDMAREAEAMTHKKSFFYKTNAPKDSGVVNVY
jgi:hypothetical protein